jgi:NodT family efflux transporter outer membrane factor (OMF) lipoprotein
MNTPFKTHRHAPFAILLAAGLLAGCAVGPDFTAPARPLDLAYLPSGASAIGAAGPGQSVQQVTLGASPRADWWTELGSPQLDETVRMAVANNWTLAAAKANLAQAGQIMRAAQGALYPQVDAAGAAERRSYGAYFLGPEAFTFPTFSAYTGGVAVSYDLDVFGGARRRIEWAAADAQVRGEALNAARLAVAGETAMTALQIAAIRAQIQTVQAIIESDQRTLDLVNAANRTGVASEMDVTTAVSQLDRDRARLPPLQQELNAAQDALATLVGRSPAAWTAPDFDLASLTLPQDIPLAVPSELVRARPDIRAAEAELHAASAQIGVATADLYPKISLSAGIAEEGLTAGPSSAAWSLIGGVTAPVFHGGALTARRRAAEDAYQAAFAQYQQTVLEAFQQVADGLHGLANAADGVRTEQQALASADQALRLTRLGYGAGNAGIVQVLDAQRLQQLAQLNLVQARTQRYIETVKLFLAAGGGLTAPAQVADLRR